jgi:ribosomal 50S subunit-recycling heat shock protein
VAFRAGFADTRNEARQLVRHGHFAVNGRKVNIPSYQTRAGDVITVRQLGGVVDGISQVVPGNARLTPGETAVLFLDADETLPFHYVVGMAQGKFTVQPAPDGARVTQDVHDLAFMPAAGATPTEASPAPAPGRLDALEQAVRRATQP